MKRMGSLRAGIVALACLGMLIPAPMLNRALADENPSGKAGSSDVALSDGGTLRGQVVDAEGDPLASTMVTLWQHHQEIGRTITDEGGEFTLPGLQGGTYQVHAAGAQRVFRLWAATTAPPSAQASALLVVDDCDPCPPQRVRCWKKWNKWLVAGLAAAAIAVPVAIHRSESEGPRSPK